MSLNEFLYYHPGQSTSLTQDSDAPNNCKEHGLILSGKKLCSQFEGKILNINWIVQQISFDFLFFPVHTQARAQVGCEGISKPIPAGGLGVLWLFKKTFSAGKNVPFPFPNQHKRLPNWQKADSASSG